MSFQGSLSMATGFVMRKMDLVVMRYALGPFYLVTDATMHRSFCSLKNSFSAIDNFPLCFQVNFSYIEVGELFLEPASTFESYSF